MRWPRQGPPALVSGRAGPGSSRRRRRQWTEGAAGAGQQIHCRSRRVARPPSREAGPRACSRSVLAGDHSGTGLQFGDIARQGRHARLPVCPHDASLVARSGEVLPGTALHCSIRVRDRPSRGSFAASESGIVWSLCPASGPLEKRPATSAAAAPRLSYLTCHHDTRACLG